MNTLEDLRAALLTMRERMAEAAQVRNATSSPTWRARFDTLLAKGQWILSLVERLGGVADGFSAWMRGIVGDRQELSGLPLILLGSAVIAGMLSYIIPYSVELADALDEYRDSGEFDMPSNPVSAAAQDLRSTATTISTAWKFAKIAAPALGIIWLFNRLFPA